MKRSRRCRRCGNDLAAEEQADGFCIRCLRDNQWPGDNRLSFDPMPPLGSDRDRADLERIDPEAELERARRKGE